MPRGGTPGARRRRAATATAASARPPLSAPSTVLGGEQSNTSIIYRPAESAPIICKVFRQLHDGDNPDVTLQTELASSGSPHVPASVGDVIGEWDDVGRPSGRARGHLAFAQEFLPGVEDAWRVALTAAATGTAVHRRVPRPRRRRRGGAPLARRAVPARAAVGGAHRPHHRGVDASPRHRRRRGARARAAPRGDRGVLRAGAVGRVARAAAHPRRPAPGAGAARAGTRLGAARLRGRAAAPDAGPAAPRPPRARRRGHAALVRLRGRLHGAGAARARRERRWPGRMPRGGRSSTATSRHPASTCRCTATCSPRSSSTRPCTRRSTRPATAPRGRRSRCTRS